MPRDFGRIGTSSGSGLYKGSETLLGLREISCRSFFNVVGGELIVEPDTCGDHLIHESRAVYDFICKLFSFSFLLLSLLSSFDVFV